MSDREIDSDRHQGRNSKSSGSFQNSKSLEFEELWEFQNSKSLEFEELWEFQNSKSLEFKESTITINRGPWRGYSAITSSTFSRSKSAPLLPCLFCSLFHFISSLMCWEKKELIYNISLAGLAAPFPVSLRSKSLVDPTRRFSL